MFSILSGIIARIVSNSYLNVFQKILTQKGEKSSAINFYTYCGLMLLSLPCVRIFEINSEVVWNFILMGFLGAAGNYFIIKALSLAELSSLAPINAYKPIVAMLAGIFCLKEMPAASSIFAICLIILGTYFIFDKQNSCINPQALLFRVLALIFSGMEAVFIKKLIIMTGVCNTFFLWAVSGFIFSTIFLLLAKHKPKIASYKYQILLIICVFIMQYSTNYVFSKMQVSYALALFQLSTLLSVFLGVNIFGEANLKRKLLGASVMIAGAIILII